VKLRWTLGVRDDLVAIARFIAESNESAARNWIGRLRSQAKRATRIPKSGRVVPELGREDVREFIFRGYRILYLLRDDDVFVLSVFEGHRQIRLTDDDLARTDE
jgi:plasmid stabilization system protein ParE